MTAPLSILDDRMRAALRERFYHRLWLGDTVPFVYGWCGHCKVDHSASAPQPARDGDDPTP